MSRNRLKFKVLILLILLNVLISSRVAFGNVEMKISENIINEDSKIRTELIEAMQLANSNKVKNIIDLVKPLLKEKDRQGSVKDIFLLLGMIRSTDSIGFLIDNLTFEVFYKQSKRPQAIHDRMPAVQALADIGLPALRPLVQKLNKEPTNSQRVEATRAVFDLMLPRAISNTYFEFLVEDMRLNLSY